jgi:hypothetical protein
MIVHKKMNACLKVKEEIPFIKVSSKEDINPNHQLNNKRKNGIY